MAVPEAPRPPGFAATARHWGKDVQLWLFVLASLQLFRLVLVASFVPGGSEVPARDLAAVLFMGLRFDAVIASACIVPTLALGVALGFADVDRGLRRLRRGVGVAYCAVAALAFAADYAFFREFKDQLDHSASPPRHVFLIVLESQDGWPLFRDYRHVGLAPSLAALADAGVHFPRFVASGWSTGQTLDVLLTGMPAIDVNVNYRETARRPYPTSLAPHFRRLGYRTRFFFGGYVGCRRLDLYIPDQGFDELHGAGDMPGLEGNTWGVRDEHLFDYVLGKVTDDVPSFNVILTTSNHSPYDLDLDRLGFPLRSLAAPIVAYDDEAMKVFGHYWYSDREAGRFVAAAERRLPRTLCALTGDHTGRRQGVRFPGEDVFEHFAVPFILHGPGVPGGRRGALPAAGSHLDIAPTLYELCAPRGFAYTSFGADLLAKGSPSYGFGYRWIVGEGFVASDERDGEVHALPGEPGPAPAADLGAARRHFGAIKALSWLRVMKGEAEDVLGD